MRITIPDDQVPAFWACLGVGVLAAMRHGTLPPAVGIGTLGLPKVWEPLLQRHPIPDGLVHVFQQGDELDGLDDLAPTRFQALLTDLITRLTDQLTTVAPPRWTLWTIEPSIVPDAGDGTDP